MNKLNRGSKFQVDLPPGEYELRSDKLPGFAATKRRVVLRLLQGSVVQGAQGDPTATDK
jgi:hypothetical protein